MRIKFPKLLRFGLGFGLVPVKWRGRNIAGALAQYKAGEIEMSPHEPLWDQVRAFGHEVLHAAIDFDLYCGRLAEQLRVEALDTERELKED